MEEIWKKIKSYPNYEISNYGRVRNLTHTILKTRKQNSGYELICLNNCGERKAFTVHRLVAIAFIKNKYNKDQVNHIDSVKTNNFVYNLEWVTRQENCRKAWDSGLMERARELARIRMSEVGKKYAHHISKKVKQGIKVYQYDSEMNYISTYNSLRQVELIMKINRKELRCHIDDGKTYKGYYWKSIILQK